MLFPRMIRLFYANVTHLVDTNTNDFAGIRSYVGGKVIAMDFELMNRLFKIHNRGPKVYGSKVEIECENYDKFATMKQVTGIDFQANPLTHFKAQ